MKENLKAYLNFTKKERTGIAILMMIIMIVAVAPAFFPGGPIVSDSTQLAALNHQILLFEEKQDVSPGHSGGSNNNSKAGRTGGSANDRFVPGGQPLTLFPFDPNTLDLSGWRKLGVREKTALTIQKYISKGGRFRRPDDLMRIYGMPDEVKQALLPFVRIAGDVKMTVTDRNQLSSASAATQNLYEPEPREIAGKEKEEVGTRFPNTTRISDGSRGRGTTAVPTVIDINQADTTDFRLLPGIGPVLSKRIVQFRDKLGGFYSVEQLREVYGIHDTTFQKIGSYLVCTPKVLQLNLNAADHSTLVRHPYFRQVARAILAYRQQHGTFKDIEELRSIAVITNDIYVKLVEYATL